MTSLLLVAAAAPDLDALDGAVARCDRAAANPVLAAEGERRNRFLIDAFKEQEAIVNARLGVAAQRQGLTEAAARTPAQVKELDVQDTALDSRMKALNDQRSLEAAREAAMDSMRTYFLVHCPVGGDRK